MAGLHHLHALRAATCAADRVCESRKIAGDGFDVEGGTVRSDGSLPNRMKIEHR